MVTGHEDSNGSDRGWISGGPLTIGPVTPESFIEELRAASEHARGNGKDLIAEGLSQLGGEIERTIVEGRDAGPQLARAGLLLGYASEDDELLYHTGGAVGVLEAAELFGTTFEAVSAMICRGQVLTVMFRGRVLLPRLQFEGDGARLTALPGIGEVVTAAAETGAEGWHVLQWLVLPSVVLGGIEPIRLLREGQVEAVVSAARNEV